MNRTVILIGALALTVASLSYVSRINAENGRLGEEVRILKSRLQDADIYGKIMEHNWKTERDELNLFLKDVPICKSWSKEHQQ